MNLRYAHFRNAHKGRSFTVAYTIEPEGDCFNIRFGVAVCHPGDAFVKAKGRMIASGRYEKRYEIITAETGDNKAVLSTLRRALCPELEEAYEFYVRTGIRM
jgi:hypothetical protein